MQTIERSGDQVFSPVVIRDLRAALQTSWDVLNTIHSDCTIESRREETRELLARRLLRCAAMGETNRARLVTYAINSLSK